MISTIVLVSLGGMGALGASTWNLDWQDFHPVGLVEYRLTNGPSVAMRALTFYGSSDDVLPASDYHSLTPAWRYAGAQGISGASNARAVLGVKIDDVASTACSSSVTALVQLHRLIPNNPSESSGDCSGTSLGSFFRSKTWSTCGAGVGDFFSSSWFGAVGDNPIFVSHQDTGTPTPGDNFFFILAQISDNMGHNRNAFGCYKTFYF
jgi:hypothetical protein